MRLQKHWYLGFLGLIGLYKFSTAIAPLSGEGSWLGAIEDSGIIVR